ncbi:MAG: DUF2313 domain-containing protein [Eubacterium sp.]|nr:DUF2313 domain-containing protein [Eubacterium sp.]
MIDYLPEWLREFREIKVLSAKYQMQMDKLWSTAESLWSNNFIHSLDEHGCDRWEKILHLKKGDMYTLQDRRNNIAGRLAEQRPYTFKKLCLILDVLCGKNGYAITLFPETYTLRVKVMLTSKNMLNDVKSLLDRMIPANLVVEADLMYNVYELLKPYTYRELKAYTYKKLREEVMK